MTLASLLAISALLGPAQQHAVPGLTVLEISKSARLEETCDVTLRNSHSRAAVAWIISRLPDRHRGGHTTDVSTALPLWIAPGTTGVTRTSCRADESLPAVEVSAVLYDDGSRSGDETLLERLFAAQRRRAQGLRELAMFLDVAQLSVKPGVPLSEGFSAIIDQATGQEIGAGARMSAQIALRRVATQLGLDRPASDEQIDVVRRAIVADLTTTAAQLEMWSQK